LYVTAAIGLVLVTFAGSADAACGLKCQACQTRCYNSYQSKIFKPHVTPAQLAVYKKQYFQCKKNCL
jgi:hypothetical protein